MVVIDAHAYVGESVYLKKKFTAEDLTKRMDANGIDMAVVTAPPPGPDYQEANRRVYEATKKYPDRLLGFYKVNPWYGEAELERAETAIKEWGFKGFKLDPKNESYMVSSRIVRPVMELAGKLGVPVFFHTGDSSFCPPEAVAFLASSFQKVTVMMSHAGLGFRLATHPRLAEDLKSIVFGTYRLEGGHNGVSWFLRELPRTLDPKRVVFTTEVPFGYPELELKTIELTKVDEEIKKLIMCENIKNILKL
jgi:predicted TIM-barrel fold metal-dependent hydrolase